MTRNGGQTDDLQRRRVINASRQVCSRGPKELFMVSTYPGVPVLPRPRRNSMRNLRNLKECVGTSPPREHRAFRSGVQKTGNYLRGPLYSPLRLLPLSSPCPDRVTHTHTYATIPKPSFGIPSLNSPRIARCIKRNLCCK